MSRFRFLISGVALVCPESESCTVNKALGLTYGHPRTSTKPVEQDLMLYKRGYVRCAKHSRDP